MRSRLQVALLIYGATCCLGSTTTNPWCSLEDIKAHQEMAAETGKNLNAQSAIDIATDAFVQLMAAYPETKALLARVHGDDVKSPEFAAHAFRVFKSYGLCQQTLGDTEVVQEIASHIARQHEKRIGVKREHFKLLEDVIRKHQHQWASRYNQDNWDNCMKPVINVITANLP